MMIERLVVKKLHCHSSLSAFSTAFFDVSDFLEFLRLLHYLLYFFSRFSKADFALETITEKQNNILDYQISQNES